MFRRTTIFSAVTFLTVGLLLSGCVSVATTRNWTPQTPSLESDYYGCEMESQQGYFQSSVTVNRYGGVGSATSGARTNYDLLSSCLKSRGYQKRPATTGETVFGLVTAPIWVPFIILGAIGGADVNSNPFLH